MNKPTLENIKNLAFLSNESYKTAVDDVENKNKEISKKQPLKNPATNSSFEVVEQVNDEITGFSGTVFKDPVSGEYIIAFRGTDDLKDLAADFSDMLIDLNNRQFKSAMEFAIEQIKAILASDPNAKISLTGHSLGGSIAQFVAYKTGLKAVTFHAYGAEEIIKNSDDFDADLMIQNRGNVTNFINTNDLISIASPQYGNTYALDAQSMSVKTLWQSLYVRTNLPSQIVNNIADKVETLDKSMILLKKGALLFGCVIGEVYAKHAIGMDLNEINGFDEKEWQKVFDRPYNEGALRDMLKGVQDAVWEAIEYYQNLTYDKFTGDLKYIGEMLFDKLFGDTLNASLYDPIALDLNNNGKIDTLSLENGVFFDHNGDEIAFKSSWISAEDGIKCGI